MRTQISMIAAPAAAMTLIKGALLAARCSRLPRRFCRRSTEQGYDALCDALHFPTRAGDRHSGTGPGDAARSGRHHPEHEGREDARQDVGALHGAQRRTPDLRNISTAPASLPTPTATRSSRPSIPAMSTSRSRISIAARISLPAAPANIPASPAASRSTASPCLISPAPAATRRWTSHNTTWEIKK